MGAELIENNVANLGDFIEDVFSCYANQASFSCQGKKYSYRDIDEKSQALACWMQKRFKQGDRIIIQLPNIIQYPIAAFAAMRAGLVIVNSNPSLNAEEIRHQIYDSGAKGIIIEGETIANIEWLARDSAVTTIIANCFMPLASAIDIVDFECASVSEGQYVALTRDVGLDDIAMLQYSAGTSGVPKAAILTHRSVLSNINQIYQRINSGCEIGQDVVICPLPLHHIYGFVVCMLMFFSNGSLNVLIKEPTNTKLMLDQIIGQTFSVFCGTNEIFKALYCDPTFSKLNFKPLKLTLSGGSSLSLRIEQFWNQLTGCTITEGYGLSEASPVVCLNFPNKEQLGTIGKSLIYTSVEIWDGNDQPVSDGEEGQIVVKGPQIMRGYWNLAALTQQVMTADGFFKTGDVGIKRANGCIKIVDRLVDIITVSGVSVYPNEVEEVLMSNPMIKEAAVVGSFDPVAGESVLAYITVNQLTDIKLLILWAKNFLEASKVPKNIIIVKELPKSSVGKVLRSKLRNFV